MYLMHYYFFIFPGPTGQFPRPRDSRRQRQRALEPPQPPSSPPPLPPPLHRQGGRRQPHPATWRIPGQPPQGLPGRARTATRLLPPDILLQQRFFNNLLIRRLPHILLAQVLPVLPTAAPVPVAALVPLQDRAVPALPGARQLQVRREVPVRARTRRAAQRQPPPQVQDGPVPHLPLCRLLPLRSALPLHPRPRRTPFRPRVAAGEEEPRHRQAVADVRGAPIVGFWLWQLQRFFWQQLDIPSTGRQQQQQQ